MLVCGALLLLGALAGTPEPLTGMASGIVLVVLAAGVAALTGAAVVATGGTAIPDDVPAGRAPAARAGGEPR